MTDTSNSQNSMPVLQSELPSTDSHQVCCGIVRFSPLVLTLATVASVSLAGYFVGRNSVSQSVHPLPMIDATAAVTSEKFSMATGLISEDAEGLFVLDHNSGLLQCSVMYPRMGKVMATYVINVAETLASGGKGGNYMMVTGTVNFPRASNRPAAPSVVYVLDTATGNYAYYGVPFNRAVMNANQPQQGALVLIDTGTANPIIDRDSLR